MTQKIIIYGGSGSIGAAAARSLYGRGYGIHLVGRNEETLSQVSKDVDADYTVGDVKDENLFARATEQCGNELRGLVYAVGTVNLRNLRQLKTSDFEEDFRVNAMGAALAAQAAAPILRKSEGASSMLFISSVAASKGFPFHASMGMAKGAVSGLTLALAAELAPDVRVNAIAPSLTKTPLTEKILSNEKAADSIASAHALKRLGTPEDIAGIAAHLVADDAAWITGQIIGVDGGRGNISV